MRESPWLEAHTVAAAIQRGELSAASLLETLLDRIRTHNPPLNAVVTLDAERARVRAGEADRARDRGECWGPLHGVPITIKDAFETAGLRTVSGSRRLASHVPVADAPPVALLRQAGAIVIGKTNVPPLASGIQTNNTVFGRTNNPWDLARTPGGSSGGAAAAIAAGLSYAELGSDIGGSIRIPAHFCGVYGLKITAGRIPGQGHLASVKPIVVPADMRELLQLASFGPLARSIADVRLLLSILTGPTRSIAAPRALPELSVIWTDDFGRAPLSAESREHLGQFVGRLAERGCRVERCLDPGFDYDDAWHTAGVCLGAANAFFRPAGAQWLWHLAAPILARVGPHDPLMRGLLAGLSLHRDTVRGALAGRARLIDVVDRLVSSVDAWICPVFPTTAFTHRSGRAAIDVDGRPVAQLRANLLHAVLFNLTGLPVLTMPIARTRAGLPIGVQVIGRRQQDAALVDVGEALATATAGFVRPPGY